MKCSYPGGAASFPRATTSTTSDRIECPNCGYAIRDLDDHDWRGDEDETRTFECGSCDRPVVLKRVIRVHYEARQAT